ncbi:Hypothetical predicted protein [Mytilus galloprovincialis]|uniref:Reverse transcriptase domain-containing protein n=1 Tax=Mytilus galloprovincialis TaxID=29158 RepID=A0A8B6ECP1_MYTGA|nr:Hypothetical predicted protein [Mytilus galloprovincialis]
MQVKILREGHNTSDHYPVSAEFSVRLRTAQKQLNGDIVTKINWEKVDKTSYEQNLKEELKDRKYLNMRTPYGIEQATNQLISGLTNALNLSYPRRKSKFSRKKKISWSPQLAKAVVCQKRHFICGKRNHQAYFNIKKKKGWDVEGLTAEHLIYGGTELTEFLVTLINNIFYTKHVPEVIKKGLLTPVHKKDKDPTIPSNYRGITVISIICKILELCIRARIEGTLNKHQNKLQKGFTKGASSINIALLISEAINEAKDKNECLILITLDAEKAFDVVDHIHLFWKLYHQGINGATWLLIKELYNKTTTQVKSQGYISETFVNEQGVKQDGILSANFYKAYNKNILDTLESTNIGIKIGTNYVGCPTCADDIMLCAGSEHDASTQLHIIENCTKNDRVKINSKKTEILMINKKNKDINLQLFNEKIDEKQNIKHLGIERQEKNNPNVENRISVARATMYSLLGAGLHGINGINPLLSYKLWRTYVIPRMLYGIEILNITKTDIQKLEAFQKKTFKQILSLPQRTADAAIYILLGAESIEQLVHKAVISLFLRISKDPNSIECKIGIRQLATKDDKSNSWYINVDRTLKSYDLPSAHEIILNPEKNWKRLTHEVIDKTWKNKWTESARSKSTLKYMEVNNWNFKKPNFCWSSVRDNKRDVSKGIIKSRILTGTYKTQSITNRFDGTKSAECKLCMVGPEDYKHFLINCESLNCVRKIHQDRLKSLLEDNHIHYCSIIDSDEDLLELLVDCSRNDLITVPQQRDLERICKDWIYALHAKRTQLLENK